MQQFFLSQLDYIFFLYGLAFILLSAMCVSFLQKHKSEIPWHWLGFFALAHGTNEWLDMLAIDLGDNAWFKWVRLAVMAVSYLFLLEFGRSTCRRLKTFAVGGWVYLPLLLVAALGVLAGLQGLNASVRYALGFTGALWSAVAFWQISRQRSKGWRALVYAAAGMAFYAITGGIVVSRADFFPASVINNDTFLQFAGFPIQLVRCLLAYVIAFALWYYHEAGDGNVVEQKKFLRGRKFALVSGYMLLALLFAGRFFVAAAGEKELVKQRALVLNQAQQAALAVDPRPVLGLSGSDADLYSTPYKQLKAQLRMLRNTMPRVRFIYLMREVQGKVIFLADSEPPGSPDESPPGQVYEEASSGIRDAFANGKSIVEGPDTDRWGTWVSGYAPLNDVRTGQPFAVLGVDLDAQDYSAAIALERLKAISFIALFCAIALLALAYYRRFTEVMGQPEAMSDMFLRWGMLGIVVMAGVSLTSFIYLSARNTAQDSFQTVFQQRAVGRVEVVSQALELQIDRLDGVRRFIDHADVITRDEFEHYAGPLTVDTPLQALEWIPRVSREERAQYEDKARQDGLIGFQITEKTSDGSLVPAGDRDEYFPVYYVTPLQGNEAAAGYDLASNALRRATIEKARDGGLAVATEPVRLVQASGDTSGILVFVPVYRGPAPQTVEERRRNLRGYILGVYRGEQFLKSVYSAMPAEGLTALIEDPLAPAGRQVLYRHKLRAGTIDWDHLRMKYEVPLVMADREWRITIAPGSSFVEANLSTGYRWVLPFGCLLTGLLALFLNTLLLGRFRSEELVRQRTAELSREKEALRGSQKRFEQVAKQSREVIFEVDNKGLYTYVSELCYDIYGYTANEMVGKKYLYDLFPAEDREALTREVFASFGRKEVFRDFINPIVHRNGTTVLLSTNATPVLDGRGNLLGYLGLDRDITEAKRAEDKLLKSEERYRKITSSITDYIYTVRIENGRPGSTIYNPGCMAVTGYSVEEFLSRPSLWLEIVVPEDRLIVEKQIREVFTRANVEPIEHRITHKDGRIRWVRNTIVPQYDAHANMTSYDGLVTDITERKKAEESLKLAKEAAEKALTIKDEFTSTVSHELRTPLAAMKSSIDILATEAPGKLTDDQKVFLKRVKSNIDRLARLINDVLDLSKIESGKMAMNFVPLRPGELVQEVVESQREVANSKGLALETVFGSDLPVLLADKDRLTQVFNNLINNAIKFTQAGKITVSAFCENKLKMVFCVRDTGVGIKEEDLAKLFEKFQQVGGLSQQLGGTGLGLAICREIVSRHGGRIWAESEFGKGSSFFFSIPVRKAKRVLVVDDDRSVQELIKHLLEGTGLYEVGLASDGFEAGQRYHDFEPSLIVLDIGLPKMSGLAVCARIKGDPKTMHTSILIMSSFSTEDQVRAAWDAGCDDIMKKPFNPREVLAKVEKLA